MRDQWFYIQRWRYNRWLIEQELKKEKEIKNVDEGKNQEATSASNNSVVC